MENMPQDIFDLDSLDDIPHKIKRELNVCKRDDVEVKIIDLFLKAQRPLNLDEVTVGYYRLYGEERERKYFMNKLYTISRAKQPAIMSLEGHKGVYQLRQSYLNSLAGEDM